MDVAITALIFFTILCVVIYLPFSKVHQFRFEDGVFVGVIYFIACPLVVATINGDLSGMEELSIGSYAPLRDVQTTVFLCIGVIGSLVFQVLCKTFMRSGPPVPDRMTSRSPFLAPHWQMVFIWAVCLFYTFLASGKSGSGHWQENMADNMSSNPLLIVIANFQNIYRAVVFGLIYNQYKNGRARFFTAAFLGLIVCVMDVAFSFNRITVSFYVVMMIMMMRRYFVFIVLAMLPGLPMVAYLSEIWTVMRGIALERGFSLSSFVEAFNTAISASESGHLKVSNSVANIFEGSNLQTFNWVVNHAGLDFPLLWGKTFFLRPLLVLVPSSLVPDKPLVFGTYVGTAVGGTKGLAVNSTLLGEAVGNFGNFWPVPLFAMLFALAIIYFVAERRWPALGGWAFFIGFGLSRWDMSFAFISLVTIVPFLVFSNVLKLLRPRPSRADRERFSADL